MNERDKVNLVQEMQDYIEEHVKADDFTLEGLYAAVGYSRRHADRVFREFLGETPLETVKKIRLTDSVTKLREQEASILEVALESGFDSHEGYTRAFARFFDVTPSSYRKKPVAVPLFIQYPITHYYNYLHGKEENEMETNELICMVTPVERPKRKLLFLRSVNATDYFSFCEEKGCEWDGLLNSIPEKFDTAALLELPPFLQKHGFSKIASGVEVPFSYNGKIPEGYDLAELPPCLLLYFQTEPYENEEDFGIAIGCAFRAAERYDYEKFGYERVPDAAPFFNFGAEAAKGASIAVPARKR